MKYFIQTYGCQMNFADSERIKTVFKSRGLEEAEQLEDADYVVLNSCAVRKKAEDKLFGKGVQIAALKRANSVGVSKSTKENRTFSGALKRAGRNTNYPVVIMTGCIVKTGIRGRVKRKSAYDVQKDIQNRADWIDHAIPTKQVFKLISRVLDKDPNVQELVKNMPEGAQDSEYLTIDPSPYSEYQASLPISVGCNHHCTFCTVPYSRGEETFRTYSSIKKEYKGYIENDFKQITLLGQTVNKWLNPNYKYPPKAYGWYKMGEILPNSLDGDGKEPDNFLTLLKELDSVKGEYWLSFISSYPNYFTDELIDYIVDSITSQKGHIMPWIHLALQSGNNEMLKRMYRHYTTEEFKTVVKKFRERLPDIAITTDIIVGFCDETEEEFKDSMKIIEEVDFDMIYISEYSVRPDTPAEEWQDNVPKKIKKRRKQEMNDLLENMLSKRNKKFVGAKHKVLISDRHHNNLIGKNQYSKDVEVVAENLNDVSKFLGKFVEVEVTESSAWNLKGRLLD